MSLVEARHVEDFISRDNEHDLRWKCGCCNQATLKLDVPFIQYGWCPNKRRGNRIKEEITA